MDYVPVMRRVVVGAAVASSSTQRQPHGELNREVAAVAALTDTDKMRMLYKSWSCAQPNARVSGPLRYPLLTNT